MDNKFDGDKTTGMGVMSQEATEESRRLMRSRSFYVLATGKVAHSVNTDTIRYLAKGLLSSPEA